jgi:hypothetical protein
LHCISENVYPSRTTDHDNVKINDIKMNRN